MNFAQSALQLSLKANVWRMVLQFCHDLVFTIVTNKTQNMVQSRQVDFSWTRLPTISFYFARGKASGRGHGPTDDCRIETLNCMFEFSP